MEALHMPMREIQKRYTKSEMIIMAWRSQESAYNMRNRVHRGQTREPQEDDMEKTVRRAYGVTDRESDVNYGDDVSGLEKRLGSVAKKLDESMDVRHLTGPEMMTLLQAQGIRIPMMAPIQRKKKG